MLQATITGGRSANGHCGCVGVGNLLEWNVDYYRQEYDPDERAFGSENHSRAENIRDAGRLRGDISKVETLASPVEG
jgi:hypothetical protein